MELIEFYVGINPKDETEFYNFINTLREQLYNIDIVGEFDNSDGYYTYEIKSTWEVYTMFLEYTRNDELIKSLEHFEEFI